MSNVCVCVCVCVCVYVGLSVDSCGFSLACVYDLHDQTIVLPNKVYAIIRIDRGILIHIF